ncbi:hypothetical protein CFIMG_005872RA [Ceratocystis fimbriata CBS 114723]|uniref:Uncharacterized protein n=1 Tax=Ceratocystis fimbriata CBS 114723 TaxID=1035309 RepID=A0A2C5WX71_9PEZI|nr:hypothetical protein CFIMG_005872RA [Ceratocystis fimbriata CBS 114723]
MTFQRSTRSSSPSTRDTRRGPTASSRSAAPRFTLAAVRASSSPAASTVIPRTARGKAASNGCRRDPTKRPSTNLIVPRIMTLAPLRAPKRTCAASPPLPWHTGIHPNHGPIAFINATLYARGTTPGAGWCGMRSALSALTATMLLSNVRGAWPTAILKAPAEKCGVSDGFGSHGCKLGSALGSDSKASTRPSVMASRADGKRGVRWVASSRTKTPSAHKRLSNGGWSHGSGASSEAAGPVTSESPAPSWMPLTMGTGTVAAARRRRPDATSTKHSAPTAMPAAATAAGAESPRCDGLHRLDGQRHSKDSPRGDVKQPGEYERARERDGVLRGQRQHQREERAKVAQRSRQLS